MKLLLYSHYWLPVTGGVQTVVTNLARGLAANPSLEIEVTLVTQTQRGQMDDAALQFRIVRRPGALKLLSMIRSTDIVHVANPAFLPMLFASLLRKPAVVEHDGYQTACPNGLLLYGEDRSVCPGHFMAAKYHKCVQCQSAELGWARSVLNTVSTFFRRWLAKGARANVVPSRHIGNRVSLPRTQLIYHGVPLKKPQNAVSSGGPTPICFAFVGRLVSEKGVDLLLRAANQLCKNQRDFRVRIVGDGPERERLEQMSADLGLTHFVEFVGGVSTDQVDCMLSSAEVVVMPSTWEDVAPLVALEQMMQGRLVIASDIGGLGETVGEFGLKFPAGDVDALVSCMRYVITNREAIRDLRRRAWQHALEMYGETRMVEQHAELYQTITG